jgi:threonylcarbamoyladenosine tRNA methylthiotransferase MtaB
MRMRRTYNTKEYLSIVDKIKAQYSDFNFTTDIIVGFPGETDAEFEETCQIVRQVGFSHVHTFPYSVRSDTRAARMPDQISERIKNERSKIIRDIAEANKHNYRKSFVGQAQTVLTEKVRGKVARGYGQHYIPIEITGENIASNMFYKTIITNVLNEKEPILTGNIVF